MKSMRTSITYNLNITYNDFEFPMYEEYKYQ